MFVYLNEPTLKTIVLFSFRFGSDIKLKSSSIHLSFWQDLNEPSIAANIRGTFFYVRRVVDLMKTAKVNAYIMHIFVKIDLLSIHAT